MLNYNVKRNYNRNKIINHIEELKNKNLITNEELNIMNSILQNGWKKEHKEKFNEILNRNDKSIDDFIQEDKEPILVIPKIEEQDIKITDNDYQKYYEVESNKIKDELDTFWKYHFNEVCSDDLDALDIKKYGKDKMQIRTMFYKKNLCNLSTDLLKAFIHENTYIKDKYYKLMEVDIKSDVFNRNDLKFFLVSESRKIAEADRLTILVLKYIFSIRYTFKESLYKIFPILTKSKVDYLLKRLEFNNLITTKRSNSKRTTIIIPTNVLDNLILGTEKKIKNRISEYDYIKSVSKNNYVISQIENEDIKTIDDIEKVLKRLPDSLLYRGADRTLLNLRNTETRYKLEYYYTKLQDIKNSLKCFITQNSNSKDEDMQKKLEESYIKLYDTLDYLLEKCYTSTASFGKYKSYSSFSLRSFADCGVYIYDIKIEEVKTNEITEYKQSFKVLSLQTLEDYRTSKYVNKMRDIIIYMCSNNFEDSQYCDSNTIQFYDEYTRQIFFKKITSIKNRVKEPKNYFMFDNRISLAKSLAGRLYI